MRGQRTGVLTTRRMADTPAFKSVRAITLHSQGKMKEDGGKFVRYEDAAHIQTSDGFFINLDVSILYRVIDPYKVVTEFGAGTLYEQNGIVMQAEPTLKSTMGTLHPEDFFDAAKRVAKQNEARKPRRLSIQIVSVDLLGVPSATFREPATKGIVALPGLT